MYVNAQGNAGFGITFGADKTYSAYNLFLTSQTSADAEMATGTYAVSGQTIAVTPTKSTCPGPAEVESFSHSFGSGGNLLLTLPSGIINLERNTSEASSRRRNCGSCTGACPWSY
jgi:hypothetical protein